VAKYPVYHPPKAILSSELATTTFLPSFIIHSRTDRAGGTGVWCWGEMAVVRFFLKKSYLG